ncbi:carbohydrate kinase family protein [Streptomyces libani]|uniref:2-dehydro-3-deoxygluconokinase n=2 Tax=Streptomyces nigrescens TaxID=1920 RepID=A0A640TAW4_STRNI|nr:MULTISPECIES: carbohydrate kinase family protein [Streptomyces]MCW7990385.1 carbohydrate kinase [Streptomyces platensis subsp. clarensis]MYT12994.1 carbohydrate kinase family protein [Streptomyces sp. SID4951]MYX05239.1 carbohydrate kinase family protein [Streptomyces sp. SID8375]MCX5447579.1 carbohydrate kinase family protein [Streptomyces libani]WAT95614.1 carbohydrate kinase family protein [Streptomyces libani subsp. libani]
MTFQQVSEPYDAYDVLVVGGSGVDTLVQVGALPVPLADSYPVPPLHEGAGHTGTGVALGCAALGLTTGFVDFLGDDHPGTLVRERLAGTGVDFRPLISPHGTRRAVNLVAPDGRRMSFYDARDPADLRMPPEHYLPPLRRARHVHLSIMHFARFLYDDIEALGIPVSTDLQDWDGLTDHHREFALRSDLVFLSTAGAGERIGSVMREILHEGRAEAVIATAGAGGAYLLSADDRTPRPVPAAVPPGPVVDSNGAGDAFTSGFLYGRLAGRSLEECARLGAVAGAYACTSRGTHTALVGPQELHAALGAKAPATVITSPAGDGPRLPGPPDAQVSRTGA